MSKLACLLLLAYFASTALCVYHYEGTPAPRDENGKAIRLTDITPQDNENDHNSMVHDITPQGNENVNHIMFDDISPQGNEYGAITIHKNTPQGNENENEDSDEDESESDETESEKPTEMPSGIKSGSFYNAKNVYDANGNIIGQTRRLAIKTNQLNPAKNYDPTQGGKYHKVPDFDRINSQGGKKMYFYKYVKKDENNDNNGEVNHIKSSQTDDNNDDDESESEESEERKRVVRRKYVKTHRITTHTSSNDDDDEDDEESEENNVPTVSKRIYHTKITRHSKTGLTSNNDDDDNESESEESSPTVSKRIVHTKITRHFKSGPKHIGKVVRNEESESESNSESEESEERNERGSKEETRVRSHHEDKEKDKSCKSRESQCVNVRPTKDHHEFLKYFLSHRTYISMSHRRTLEPLSQSLRKKPWHDESSDKACFRVLWAEQDKRIYGFDKLYKYKCDEEDILQTGCICDHDPENEKTMNYTVVWSDGKSNALVIECLGDKPSWKVLSLHRSVPDSVRDKILKLLDKYGLEHKDHVRLDYSDCPKYVSEEAFDGHCDPDFRGETLTQEERDFVFNMTRGGVYTPLISLLNIYGQSRFLRGKTLTDKEELDRVCRKDHWTKHSITISGFAGEHGILKCDMTDLGDIECIPDDDNSYNKKIFIYNTKMSVVWTNKVDLILIVNCLTNNMRTWVLYSTCKAIDEEAQLLVRSKIVDFGFNMDKVYTVPYDQCAANGN